MTIVKRADMYLNWIWVNQTFWFWEICQQTHPKGVASVFQFFVSLKTIHVWRNLIMLYYNKPTVLYCLYSYNVYLNLQTDISVAIVGPGHPPHELPVGVLLRCTVPFFLYCIVLHFTFYSTIHYCIRQMPLKWEFWPVNRDICSHTIPPAPTCAQELLGEEIAEPLWRFSLVEN